MLEPRANSRGKGEAVREETPAKKRFGAGKKSSQPGSGMSRCEKRDEVLGVGRREDSPNFGKLQEEKEKEIHFLVRAAARTARKMLLCVFLFCVVMDSSELEKLLWIGRPGERGGGPLRVGQKRILHKKKREREMWQRQRERGTSWLL